MRQFQLNVLNIMGMGEWERFSHVAMRIKGLSQQRRTGNGTSGKLNQFGIKIDKKIVSFRIDIYFRENHYSQYHDVGMQPSSLPTYTAAARHARGAAI